METSKLDLDLIDKYLRDDFTQRDQENFDQRIKEEQFRKELLYQAQLLKAIEEAKETEIRELFAKLEQERSTSKMKQAEPTIPAKRRILMPLLRYAAGVAFLLTCFIVAKFCFNSKLDNKSLYTEYYKAIPSENIARGAINTEDVNFQKAMLNYVEKDYSSSLDHLKEIEPITDKALLYIASCHMQLKDFDKAAAVYKMLESSEKFENREIADWYLTLIYLRKGNKENYTQYLNKILKNPKHLFYTSAESLQLKLKQ